MASLVQNSSGLFSIRLPVGLSGHLQNDGAAKADPQHLPEEALPVDPPVAGGHVLTFRMGRRPR